MDEPTPRPIDLDDMPDGRKLALISEEALFAYRDQLGEVNWGLPESKLLVRTMKVTDRTKVELLLISKRTGLSPSRAIAVAVEALLDRTNEVSVPTPDDIHRQLLATTSARSGLSNGS